MAQLTKEARQMKKKRKIIIPTVLVAAVLVITAVVLYHNPLPGMEGWFPQQTSDSVGQVGSAQEENTSLKAASDETAESIPADSLSDNSALSSESNEEIDTYQLNPEKTFQLNQSFQEGNLEGKFEITVKDATMSKDLQGHPVEYFDYGKESEEYPSPGFFPTVDTQGNMLSDHSYLFTTLTIENLEDVACTLSLKRVTLLFIEEGNRTITERPDHSSDMEVHYVDVNEDKFGTDDYYFLTLEPHEKIDVTLAYVIHDPDIFVGDRLFLHFNLAGTGTSAGESDVYYYPAVDLKLPE